MHIQIYSRAGCTYCTKAERVAKEIVQNPKHTYDKYMLNEDFTREQLFEKFPEAKTFPQITIDGFHIGGYTEFFKKMYPYS